MTDAVCARNGVYMKASPLFVMCYNLGSPAASCGCAPKPTTSTSTKPPLPLRMNNTVMCSTTSAPACTLSCGSLVSRRAIAARTLRRPRKEGERGDDNAERGRGRGEEMKTRAVARMVCYARTNQDAEMLLAAMCHWQVVIHSFRQSRSI